MARTTKGRLYKRGSIYWLEYYVSGVRRQESLGVTTKVEAETLRQEKVRPLEVGDKVAKTKALVAQVAGLEEELKELSVSRSRIPLDKAWDLHPYDRTSPRRGSVRKLTPRGIDGNRETWTAFIRWLADHHRECRFMEDVTPAIATEYSNSLLRRDISSRRFNGIIGCCGVMYALAERTNPFAGVKRHEVRHESRNNLELEQLQAVCSSATGELRRLFAILVYTGLRLGDAVTLKWESIRDGRIFNDIRKTRKELAFPLLPALAQILAEVPEADRHGPVCPDFARKYARTHTLISRYIKDHLERCGIQCVEMVPGRKRGVSRYGAHSFRHSFITACARAGVPSGLIRDWVGHESPDITRIYEHWRIQDGSGQIAAALPAAATVFALPAITVDAVDVEDVEALRKKVVEAAKTASADRLKQAMAFLVD